MHSILKNRDTARYMASYKTLWQMKEAPLIQQRKCKIKYNMKVGQTETKRIKQIKPPHIRIYKMRASQFRHGHKPYDQKANNHMYV